MPVSYELVSLGNNRNILKIDFSDDKHVARQYISSWNYSDIYLEHIQSMF